MGAQRTVALSLDIESHLIWEQLPKGERSRRVRKDFEIELLENQIETNIDWIRKLRMSNQELRDFGCRCVVAGVPPEDLE